MISMVAHANSRKVLLLHVGVTESLSFQAESYAAHHSNLEQVNDEDIRGVAKSRHTVNLYGEVE